MSEKESKPGVLAWLALFVAFPVAYILSENFAPIWMRWFYAPLWWIRQHFAR